MSESSKDEFGIVLQYDSSKSIQNTERSLVGKSGQIKNSKEIILKMLLFEHV